MGRPERLSDLFPAGVAALAATHTLVNGEPPMASSIRVHLATEVSLAPAEFPGGYWDVSTTDGPLTIVDDEDVPVARFQPGVWAWVETVKDGAA